MLAAEFPDIFQQFVEPKPSPPPTKSIGQFLESFDANSSDGSELYEPAGVSVSQSISLEHNYDQKLVRDANKNTTIKSSLVSHSVYSEPEDSSYTEGEQTTGQEEEVVAAVEETLALLARLDSCPAQQEGGAGAAAARQEAGCSWPGAGAGCNHGAACPWPAQLLGLDRWREKVQVVETRPRVHSVVVLRQTPHGLVKLQESLVPLGEAEVARLQGMSPQDQVRQLGLTAGPRQYRPPPNTVVVKVPGTGQGAGQQLLCSECDTQFHDNKSLVKHTRNQHQVYQCSKCGEQTTGYYRMASHTKKNHSKEPVFYCQCGRNFSEKRGLTKHQNSCSFYRQ